MQCFSGLTLTRSPTRTLTLTPAAFLRDDAKVRSLSEFAGLGSPGTDSSPDLALTHLEEALEKAVLELGSVEKEEAPKDTDPCTDREKEAPDPMEGLIGA